MSRSDRLLALVNDMLLAAQVSADSRDFARVPADLAILALPIPVLTSMRLPSMPLDMR